MRLFIVLLPFLFFLISCEEGTNCDASINAVKIKFKKELLKNTKDTTITGFGARGIYPEIKDSILYNNDDKFLTTTLPLSKNSDTSVYEFYFYHPKDTILNTTFKIDTVFFVYSRKVELVSSDCGFVIRFDLKSVLLKSNRVIKGITLKKPVIDNLTDPNVEVIL